MRSSLRAIALFACVGSLAGCVSVSKQQYANLSAGVIGCPAEELKISGEKETFGIGDQVTPWTAECRGHRFICSAAGQTVSCKEELKAAEAPTPAATPQASDSVK